MANEKPAAGYRPQFTLDLRKANPAAFAALVEQFDRWRADQPTPTIHLEDGWHTITPEMAEQILMLNSSNRKASIATIIYYADQMVAGDWQETGQPVIFGLSGVLLDAQHRLWACYLSGVSFTTYVVNLRKEIPGVFAYIDNAKSRTIKDALYTSGLDGLSGTTALVLNMSWLYENNAYTPTEKRKVARMAPKRAIDYVSAHPNLLQGVRLIAGEHAAAAAAIGHKDVAAFTAAKILDLYDEAVLDEFMDGIATEDANAAEGDPIAALQQVIAADRVKVEQMKKHQVLGHVILAFNAWIGRKTVKKLKLAVAEPFPQFAAPEPLKQAAE